MDDARRHALADFLHDQLVQTPKMLRILFVLALLVCGLGLFILAAVTVSGAARVAETAAPLVLFLGLTGAFFLGAVWSQLKIVGAPRHPVVTAVRSDARRVNRLVPTTVRGRSGARPALSFFVDGKGPYLIFMGQKTRSELVDWLATEGATVG